jgi:aspartyl-tRNA(Asn)/glutamyl-tRNA(Gln) amidotransferase subunit A
MTVRELGTILRKKEASCAELVDRAIAEADKQSELRAFITFTETQAREEAAERDRELASGVDRGPLHGIPIAYKDLFYTRGIKTTAGSRVYENFVPDFDADVVVRLRSAGAISIGKTNLHELAFGITSRNPHYGPVLNPLDHSRLVGGSSGGSAAAIAAGMVPMALGSDTGGSVRIPASYCGIVGFKPTYDRVSRRGVVPLAFSSDHVGPLGSCVEDCAFAFSAMTAGESTLGLEALTGFKGVRVGVARNFFFDDIDEEVAASVRKSISLMENHGAALIEVQVPDFAEINVAARLVQLAEVASIYWEQKDATLFGKDVWSLLEQGRMVAGHEYINGQRLRTLFRRDMDRVWEKVDLLATPTTPVVAPPIDTQTVKIGTTEESVRMASTRLVRGINYLGEPALSMPCGKAESGLPIGLQLISAPFSDEKLLRVAKTLEGMLKG